MRQNAILFLTFTALLLGAYLFEEIGGQKQTAEEEKRTNLFDMKKYGELKSFRSPEAEIKILSDGTSITLKHNWPVDPVKLQKFFSILTGVRSKRILSSEELSQIDRKTMFPTDNALMTFTFEKGEVGFRIGKKLDTEQSFYLEVIQADVKTIVIAHDTGQVTTIYNQEESWRDDTKYKRFLTLFYLKDTWFYDMSVFSTKEKIEIQKIVELDLDNYRNKKFKLLFNGKDGGGTRPSPIVDIDVNTDSLDVYMNKVLNIKAEKILFEADVKKLKELKSTLTMILGQGERKEVTLFGEFDGKEGYFLKTDRYVFKLSKAESSPFFENVQYFWNKSPTSKTTLFNQQKDSSITFPKGREISFKLSNKKGFQCQDYDTWYTTRQRRNAKNYQFPI